MNETVFDGLGICRDVAILPSMHTLRRNRASCFPRLASRYSRLEPGLDEGHGETSKPNQLFPKTCVEVLPSETRP